jgi:hypothetical protein
MHIAEEVFYRAAEYRKQMMSIPGCSGALVPDYTARLK